MNKLSMCPMCRWFSIQYTSLKKIITKLSSTGVYHTWNTALQAEVRATLKRVEKDSLFVAVHVDMNMKRLSYGTTDEDEISETDSKLVWMWMKLSPILFAYHKALLLYVYRNVNTHRNLLEQHTEEIKILDEKSSSLRWVFVSFVVLFWTTAKLTCFSASKDRCKVDKKRYENLTVTCFN